MPPHGAGMVGSSHSHDSRFPDDTWNLYSMLDAESTSALNVTRRGDVMAIFKPHALRLSGESVLMSDADGEVIITARFTSPVSVRKLMVIGGGDEDHHPAMLRCYVQQDNIDFQNVEEFRPAQEFRLPINAGGTVELTTVLQPFTNISTLTFYFPRNHGDGDSTIIQYIGMQGEHTHYKREAVDTVYEVLCNGQDIHQPEDAMGAHAHHMH